MVGIVGTWTLDNDWGCSGDDGNPLGPLTLTFKADGTYERHGATDGKWFTVGETVVWLMDEHPIVYTATLRNDHMMGVMGWMISGGDKGCFTGETFDGEPPLFSPQPRDIDPFTNKPF